MKFKSLLILTLLFATLAVNAQNFTRNWQKLAGDAGLTWLTAAANMHGIAYNPKTNKLYVSVRGAEIYILDPATGDATLRDGSADQTTLIKTGIDASIYLFNKIAVTPTGEIYAITSAPNNTAPSVTGQCTVWYWSSESADPVVAIAHNLTGAWLSERAGDTFAVTGSGDNAVIYVGGLNTAKVQVFSKVNGAFQKFGTDIVLDKSNPVVGGLAGAAIVPVTTGTESAIWISGHNYGKRKYSSTSTRLATLGNNEFASSNPVANTVSKKFLGLKYFEISNKKFLSANGAYHEVNKPAITGEETTVAVFDITNVTDVQGDVNSTVTHVASSKMDNPTLGNNVIPVADLTYKRIDNPDGTVTMQFFQLIKTTGISSHTIKFNANGTLPVTLSSFNASVINNQNQLVWSTASESNNSGFEIESSVDGTIFTKIGFVASKSANSNTNLNYSFTDKLAESGTTYYRLKQVDIDGKYSFSDVKFINNQLSGSGISVYPNPADDYIMVSGLSSKGFTVALFNSSGVEVNTKGLIEGDKVNLKGLTAGYYIVNVSKNGKILHSSKIVKR